MAMHKRIKCESKQVQEIKSSFAFNLLEMIMNSRLSWLKSAKTSKMKTIRKFLVSNKTSLHLQVLLVQFLSVAMAESNDSSNAVTAANSTQSALRNQIAGNWVKLHFSLPSICTTIQMQCENFHSDSFEFISSKLIAMLRLQSQSRQLRFCTFLTRSLVPDEIDQDSSC